MGRACSGMPVAAKLAHLFPAVDLESLMRAALGALASFNEDERMILTRRVELLPKMQEVEQP